MIFSNRTFCHSNPKLASPAEKPANQLLSAIELAFKDPLG